MSEKHITTGWVIVGAPGIYSGWSHTKNAAIAAHLADLAMPVDSRFTRDDELSEQQFEAWRVCERNGDRAVQCIIIADDDDDKRDDRRAIDRVVRFLTRKIPALKGCDENSDAVKELRQIIIEGLRRRGYDISPDVE